MNTNLKVLLTAIGIATLASPVMAQSMTNRPYVGTSAVDISNAHGSVLSNARGSVAGARRERTERVAPITEGNQVHIDDAVHTPFPQQSGSGY
jgi:hypothetical protein